MVQLLRTWRLVFQSEQGGARRERGARVGRRRGRWWDHGRTGWGRRQWLCRYGGLVMRKLYATGGIIRNVVEHAVEPTETVTSDGEEIVDAVTGSEAPGEAFDVTPALQEREVRRHDGLLVKELFRLSNAVRVLQGQAALTAAQYRAFLKTLL